MIPKSLSNNSKILIIQLNFKPSSFFTIHREVYDFQFIFKKGITIQLLIEMIYRFENTPPPLEIQVMPVACIKHFQYVCNLYVYLKFVMVTDFKNQ